MGFSKSCRLFGIYIGSSFVFATIILFLALQPVGWSHFYNSRPARGEMGFGKFMIRGTRFVDGKSTPFAYAWRLVDPTRRSRAVAWIGYIVHQLGQWIILALAQKSKQRWGTDYRWWNWSMVCLNGFMLVYKIAQAHTFYDGLAVDVSEAVTQGSVIAILVIALILAIPSRGVIFGLGRKPSSELFAEMMQFAKKYHGYLVSFGTVTNFHYHPAEGTIGHYGGFIYQCLFLWQSTNFLHQSHRNKSWILFLELWVFIHGSVTALIQPGSTWQIFSFGFLAVFLLNQVYWTRLAKHPFILATLYALYGIWVAWVFREDKKYFRIIFIPAAEYLCLGFTVAVGMLTAKVLRFIKSYHLKVIVTTVMYVLTGIAISVSLALILGGNIRVYNDY